MCDSPPYRNSSADQMFRNEFWAPSHVLTFRIASSSLLLPSAQHHHSHAMRHDSIERPIKIGRFITHNPLAASSSVKGIAFVILARRQSNVRFESASINTPAECEASRHFLRVVTCECVYMCSSDSDWSSTTIFGVYIVLWVFLRFRFRYR